MRYELHYAEKDLQGDIPCYKLKDQDEVIYLVDGFVKHPVIDRHNTVYLCAIEIPPNDNGVILVDENYENILSFVRDHTNTPTIKKIFLQEYSSYEEAYKVALDMKEVSKLCYE